MANPPDLEAEFKLVFVEYINDCNGAAMKRAEALAKSGHILSKNLLGRMYLCGHGCQQNVERGLQWLMEAAADGHLDSYYAIAAHYRHRGQLLDAIEWYSKAADHEDPNNVEAAAQYHIQAILSSYSRDFAKMLLNQKYKILQLEKTMEELAQQIQHLKLCPHPDYQSAMAEFEVAKSNGIL